MTESKAPLAARLVLISVVGVGAIGGLALASWIVAIAAALVHGGVGEVDMIRVRERIFADLPPWAGKPGSGHYALCWVIHALLSLPGMAAGAALAAFGWHRVVVKRWKWMTPGAVDELVRRMAGDFESGSDSSGSSARNSVATARPASKKVVALYVLSLSAGTILGAVGTYGLQWAIFRLLRGDASPDFVRVLLVTMGGAFGGYAGVAWWRHLVVQVYGWLSDAEAEAFLRSVRERPAKKRSAKMSAPSYSVKLLEPGGIRYSEGERSAIIDADPVAGGRLAIRMQRLKYWAWPHGDQFVSEEERARMCANIEKELRDVEIDWQ